MIGEKSLAGVKSKINKDSSRYVWLWTSKWLPYKVAYQGGVNSNLKDSLDAKLNHCIPESLLFLVFEQQLWFNISLLYSSLSPGWFQTLVHKQETIWLYPTVTSDLINADQCAESTVLLCARSINEVQRADGGASKTLQTCGSSLRSR